MKYNGTFKEYISELEDRKYNLCTEIVSTPFFMFKKVLTLSAKIKQIKSDISLAIQYERSQDKLK